MKRGRLCECAVGQARQKKRKAKHKEGKGHKKGKREWGNMTSKVKRRIKKDEILVDTFFQCKFSYVKRAKVARNVTL